MKINVQLIEGGPITQMEQADLIRSEGVFEDDNERTTWVEYRLPSADPHSRAIHRSVHVHLKKQSEVFSTGIAAAL